MFQAVESGKLSSGVEDGAINVFDSKSPVFLACVIALSLFLIVVLVGGKLSFFITKNRSGKKDGKFLKTSGNDLATKGNRFSRHKSLLSIKGRFL